VIEGWNASHTPQPKAMGFPRRRSLWLKVAILAGAVWLTVCFLLYTEDRAVGVAEQGLQQPVQQVVQQQALVAGPQMANGFVPPAVQVLKKETPSSVASRPKPNHAGPEQGE
jgi:polypeptide N-acetylgalactosaminyltransferase